MNVILLRYSEIHLKGRNRGYFENLLIGNIRKIISPYGARIKKSNSRYVVDQYASEDENILLDRLSKVFGLHSLSPAVVVDSDFELISETVLSFAKKSGTFRINVNRADKTFPMSSVEAAAELGGRMLEKFDRLQVDLHHPDFSVSADIREDGKTYVFRDTLKCVGGMPVGSAGKALLMLSGGIDSPVAGYMMAKRGLKLSCVHFYSPPYTSEFARQKAEDLARQISCYTGALDVYFVPFSKVQEAIHQNCDASFMITVMRRIMMRICNKLCAEHGYGAIVTGESLGQVASQTLESMTVTNLAAEVPVLRPLVGFDKEEIIAISRKIDTFEISIKPYDDCCTVFLPDNPQIHPKLYKVEREESRLDIDSLIEEALSNVEKKTVLFGVQPSVEV